MSLALVVDTSTIWAMWNSKVAARILQRNFSAADFSVFFVSKLQGGEPKKKLLYTLPEIPETHIKH